MAFQMTDVDRQRRVNQGWRTRPPPCDGRAMDDRPSPRAGGALLFVAIIVGALVGALAGQTSIGVLAGLAVGLALLVLVWLRDRR